MSHMQNRYHKAVDLDPVITGQEKNVVGLGPGLNWSRKNKCGGPRSGPN